ncbi:GNAT family N-acetyltransferase [Bacillus sp. CGMCC 1.16607]|uniref:GNAT family N-acetyltransferase n=1 Tax=Bacillus sp. CGMCC 1.16607 TaxID=3351842 RepID=UPI003636946E
MLQFYEGRDRPHTIEMVEHHFYNRRNGVVGCIIEYENTAIGYIQYYPIHSDEKRKYQLPISETIYGMDQFIGEIEYWNKGIGTLLVKSMVAYLKKDKNADRIIMDPQVQNKRAVACYEKCGFQKVRLLPNNELHEGEYRDCWLIEYIKKPTF